MEISCKQNVVRLSKTLFLEHPEQDWEYVKKVWSQEMRGKGWPLTVKWDEQYCVFTFNTKGEIVCKYKDVYHPIGYRKLTKTCYERIGDIVWHLVFGCPLW